MTAVELEPRERVPDFDPDEFWGRIPPPRHWSEMRAKYEALAALAELPEGPARSKALRAVAKRWPAALREAELVGPDRVTTRLEVVRRRPEGSRAELRREAPAAVAPLAWAELHELILDQLSFRANAGRRGLDGEGFAAWIVARAREQPELSERWPRPERIVELAGARLRPRAAYLWLAARAGLSLPELNYLLFARAGHWDRRAGDPDWAHATG